MSIKEEFCTNGWTYSAGCFDLLFQHLQGYLKALFQRLDELCITVRALFSGLDLKARPLHTYFHIYLSYFTGALICTL